MNNYLLHEISVVCSQLVIHNGNRNRSLDWAVLCMYILHWRISRKVWDLHPLPLEFCRAKRRKKTMKRKRENIFMYMYDFYAYTPLQLE